MNRGIEDYVGIIANLKEPKNFIFVNEESKMISGIMPAPIKIFGFTSGLEAVNFFNQKAREGYMLKYLEMESGVKK